MARFVQNTAEVARALAGLLAPAHRLYPADRQVPRLMLLDGLRGLAAVAVLFFHYRHFLYPPGTFRSPGIAGRVPLESLLGPLYELGHFGVQLFWMISGFVFAAVYYGRPATSREFVVNRFARLYPLHFATLLVVAAEQWAASLRFGTPLLFTHNDPAHFLLQLGFASDWLASTGMSFNGPIWSVSVEVAAYALFWLTRRWLPGLGLAGPLALAAAMTVLRREVGGTEVFACGFHFFLGVALCAIWRSFAALPRLLLGAGLAAMALGAAGLARIDPRETEIVAVVLLPLLLGGLILALVAADPFAPAWLRRALGALGDRTYSIYLVHVPVQLALFLVLGARVSGLAGQCWFLALFLGLVLALAWPCYHWFEAPARDWLRRYARAQRRAARAPVLPAGQGLAAAGRGWHKDSASQSAVFRGVDS
ncbi:acyltransferase family protein [Novosphingobium bradum]|uniref:Acyltransferase family protein n=1 Tax=Novosphingobium bradum TaxID=1737444 RepID=A0ABV7IKW3_9SPHN